MFFCYNNNGENMKYELDKNIYEVVVVRKSNKNIYIRVKEDMKIYVSCNTITPNIVIKKVLDDNVNSLRKMINIEKKKLETKDKFFYLGKNYDIIFLSSVDSTYIEGNAIISKNKETLEKWLKEETLRVFDERYVIIFNKFKENITSPILKIRDMKTRWGVYNRRNHTITLNSKLIELEVEKIDYVIVHELSHIIHFNHSKDFWSLVGKYVPEYKRIRKEMKY